MSAENIYNKLRAAGLSARGACGMMGNLMAESSLIANIAQRGMTNLSDADYTSKYDKSPAACYKDGVGYGLAQWTYWSRKQNLFEFANAKGKSVGDENTQVEFIIHELRTEYSGLFSYLCACEDMYEATSRICKEYERPAVNNIDTRYQYAQTFYKDLGGEKSTATEAFYPPDLSILILQSVLCGNGYETEITGHSNPHFLKTLRRFVTDIGG